MKTYYFALDLHDDPKLIEEYKRYHKLENVWPPVLESIRANGVVSEKIYLAGNRLFMILETIDEFSLDAKSAADAANADMRRWEELMGKFQKPLPFAQDGQKWVPMEKIFEVS
jgi:L-rhamnose mutarotase